MRGVKIGGILGSCIEIEMLLTDAYNAILDAIEIFALFVTIPTYL